MTEPSETDWSYKGIREKDETRADRLESVGTAEELLDEIVAGLKRARDEDIRVGIDSFENKFKLCRAIVQFQVTPNIYDWFFNARTGYRAQYWEGTEIGKEYNKALTLALVRVLENRLPVEMVVRRVSVYIEGESREEQTVGEVTTTRGEFIRSLTPKESKIWICERRLPPAGVDKQIDEIGFVVLSAAARGPKLDIPRWDNVESPSGERGEGLRAPNPCPDYSWLDLKGGFVQGESVRQSKSQDKRATQLHERGWT